MSNQAISSHMTGSRYDNIVDCWCVCTRACERVCCVLLICIKGMYSDLQQLQIFLNVLYISNGLSGISGLDYWTGIRE